jgi:hypothetical protein
VIATDRFVYVHQPKTGGTFVTHVLLQLQDVLQTEQLRVRNVRTRFAHTRLKHGTCRDIPRSHRHLPKVTTVRNPYDQYVSEYEFGWWKRDEYTTYFPRLVRRFHRKYPTYPDLTFDEFVRLYNEAFCLSPRNRAGRPGCVGWLTERFVRFYFRHPWRALSVAAACLGDKTHAMERMYPVAFLRMDRLNSELCSYLATCGIDADRLSFIRDLVPLRPEGSVRTAAQRWADYYDPTLRDFVRQRERLLFSLFPEFDE